VSTHRLSFTCILLLGLSIFLISNSISADDRLGESRDYSVSQRTWQQFKKGVKDALQPRFHFRKNFFGVHYKNFILGDTLTFKDEDYTARMNELNSNFNAWGIFYVNFYDALRTRFGTNFYEYVKMEHTYEPDKGGVSITANQIKLNEIDFSMAYVVYINEMLPVYAGGGLTAGHMRVRGTSQSHEKILGYVGGKLVLGGSYIFDETLYIDACYYSIPLALNQGYATTLGLGLTF